MAVLRFWTMLAAMVTIDAYRLVGSLPRATPQTMATAIVSPSARASPSTAAPIKAGADPGQRHPPRGLPVRHPERDRALAGQHRHAADQVAGGGRDDRDDHHGQHQAGRQQALAVARLAAEEACRPGTSGVSAISGRDVVGDERPERQRAPQADDDARDAGQQLQEQADVLASRRGSRSTMTMAAPMDTGTAMISAIAEVASVPTISGSAPNTSPGWCTMPCVLTGVPYWDPKSNVVPVRKLQPLNWIAGMARSMRVTRIRTSASSGTTAPARPNQRISPPLRSPTRAARRPAGGGAGCPLPLPAARTVQR